MNSFRFVNLYLLQVFRGSMLLRRWLPFLKEMQIQEVQTGMNIHVITMTNLWYKCTSTNKSNWSGVCIYWHILCTFQPPNTAAPKLGMHQQNWTSGGRDHDNTRPLRVKVTHILDPTLEVSAGRREPSTCNFLPRPRPSFVMESALICCRQITRHRQVITLYWAMTGPASWGTKTTQSLPLVSYCQPRSLQTWSFRRIGCTSWTLQRTAASLKKETVVGHLTDLWHVFAIFVAFVIWSENFFNISYIKGEWKALQRRNQTICVRLDVSKVGPCIISISCHWHTHT